MINYFRQLLTLWCLRLAMFIAPPGMRTYVAMGVLMAAKGYAEELNRTDSSLVLNLDRHLSESDQ